jgi:hypothetical protein
MNDTTENKIQTKKEENIMKKLQANVVNGGNKKLKTLKEENEMKKTILTTVLVMTVLFIFSTVSYAQGPSDFGWYGAMASLAEKENMIKEQNATAIKNEHAVANTIVADVKKDYIGTHQETITAEKSVRAGESEK